MQSTAEAAGRIGEENKPYEGGEISPATQTQYSPFAPPISPNSVTSPDTSPTSVL